jgi:hypothetical protein
MRKFLLVFCLLIIVGSLHAQVSVLPNGDHKVQIGLTTAEAAKSVIHYQLTSFGLQEVMVNGERFHTIQLDQSVPLMVAGAPEVRVLANSLIIPDEGLMEVEVLSASYQDYHDINLIPSKGNLTRDINPSDIPYQKGAAYTANRFYPGTIAQLRDPYILRDFRGQTVVTQPFQYNPVTRVLRVYYEITLQVSKTGSGGLNPMDRGSVNQEPVEEFKHLYDRHFLNFGALGINYTPVGEDGKMLIISDGNFMPAMSDFVTWKNQKGIPCEIVNVSTIGTTAAAIKTYVTNYYNTNGLTYLLLVGDAAQIPTNTLTSGHSDNAYAYISGNDHYPEFFVGRFSAENVAHVQTQVIRTLSYEINPDTTGGWLAKSMGIATLEGPGDDNELDYVHVRNMQIDLAGFTYTTNLEFFEGSQGGNDAPGNPTALMVQNSIDAGAGIILYTGHGSTTSWGTSGFSNTDIANLSNYNKWPFIWSVACVNGNFVNNTCFGEAWLRALKSDQPTGAIAIMASTINQSWNPPMEGQDEMVDVLVESYPTNIKRTFGGLSMSGCMKMNDTYGSAGDEMTDTWTLFGDPSVNVFTKSPSALTASHQPVVMIGATQFPVFCPVNGAKATLSLNGQILGTGTVASSNVNITYTSPLAPDTMTLVITAFNHFPYIAKIPVIVANAPFVTYKGHQVSDASTNNNQRADFGETIHLNLSLENIGVQPAAGVSVILRSLDPHVIVTDSTANYGTINDGVTQQLMNAFTLSLSDSVPDGHLAAMRLFITDNNSNQWTSNFSLVCHAPHLVIDTIYFDDVNGGNGNGKLEPGEVAVVNAVLRNAGGAEATLYHCSGLSSLPYVQLLGNVNLVLNGVPLQTPDTVQFFARMDTATPIGTTYQLMIDYTAGFYQAQRSIGDVIQSGDEDFETGNFQKFNWQHGGSSPWTITNTLPYQGVNSARSGVIGNSASSTLSIDWFAAYPDTISFWLKVSCENGSASGQKWDYLEFSIDGIAKDWWDGNKAWMKVSYPVGVGQHTFTWKYAKDAYATGGSDAAWIDMITFPAAGSAVVLKPFLLMEQVVFSDINGNNNGMINAGEPIDIGYKVSNIGYLPAQNVNGIIANNDPMVTLTDPNGSFGTLTAGSTMLSGQVMQVHISSNAPTGHTFNYTLTLIDDSGRVWSYPFAMEVDAAIGVDEMPIAKESLVIYPNPFTDQLFMVIPGTLASESVRISIFTVDGRIVLDQILEGYVPGERLEINTSGFPAGALMIRVIKQEEVLTGRVIRR